MGAQWAAHDVGVVELHVQLQGMEGWGEGVGVEALRQGGEAQGTAKPPVWAVLQAARTPNLAHSAQRRMGGRGGRVAWLPPRANMHLNRAAP